MPSAGLLDKQAEWTSAQLAAFVDSGQKQLEAAIQELEKDIAARVAKLKTSPDGRLEGVKANLKQSQKIHRDLTQMFREKYGKEARSVVRGWNEIDDWIMDNFKELDVAAKWTAIDADMVTALRRSALSEFDQFGADAVNRIKVALYQHVAAMAPFELLEKEISAVLTGHKATNGRPMTSYAQQYAFDATMQYHNAVNLKKAEDAGLDHFRYRGGVIMTTRPFCFQRRDRVFSKEEIESWTFHWKGKSGPAMTNRGGYNCIHHWQATDPAWLEEGEEIDKVGPPPKDEYQDADEKMADQEKKLEADVAKAKGEEKLSRKKAAQKVTEDIIEIDVRPEASKEWTTQVKKEHLKQAKELAAEHGLSVEEYMEAAEKNWIKLVNKSEPFVRVNEDTLTKILHDGRFKTHAEAKAFDATMRHDFEEAFFGAPKTLPKDKRPIYGYLSDRNDGGLYRRRLLDEYGEVAVKLKRSVRERATFCAGDSMGDTRVALKPTMRADKLMKPSINSSKIEKGAYYSADPLVWTTTDHAGGIGYVEVQVWDGVSTEDIDEVLFRRAPTKKLQNALKVRGIRWKVIKEEG